MRDTWRSRGRPRASAGTQKESEGGIPESPHPDVLPGILLGWGCCLPQDPAAFLALYPRRARHPAGGKGCRPSQSAPAIPASLLPAVLGILLRGAVATPPTPRFPHPSFATLPSVLSCWAGLPPLPDLPSPSPPLPPVLGIPFFNLCLLPRSFAIRCRHIAAGPMSCLRFQRMNIQLPQIIFFGSIL